jgi:hypothetical protein
MNAWSSPAGSRNHRGSAILAESVRFAMKTSAATTDGRARIGAPIASNQPDCFVTMILSFPATPFVSHAVMW